VTDNKVLTADPTALVDVRAGVAEVITEELFAAVPAEDEPIVVPEGLVNTDEAFKRLAVAAAVAIDVQDIAERMLVTPFVLQRFSPYVVAAT